MASAIAPQQFLSTHTDASPPSSKTLDPPPQPIPPSPDPPPPFVHPIPTPNLTPPSANTLPDPNPKLKWSTLFAAKPKNAGTFTADDLELKFDGENLIPTDDIIQASKEQWNEFLVGFFLDSPLPYYAVVNFLKNHWKPQGMVDFKSNGSIFFFHFSSLADRIRVLEADPVIIHNKLFIVKPWEPRLSNVANSVTVVPVWIKMYNIPLVAWSKRGISWLATRVGKFLCMDSNTESMKRLEFAKCMVEVSSISPLPDSFPFRNLDGTIQRIKVLYLWKPELCTLCNVFGHSTDKCQNLNEQENGKTSNVVETSDKSLNQSKENRIVKAFTGARTDMHKGVRDNRPIQRPRSEVTTKSDSWTRVVKKKSPVRIRISGKEKGKQVLVDVSPPVQVDAAVGTSNRFSLLPVSEMENSAYEINHDLEEGEYRDVGNNDKSIRDDDVAKVSGDYVLSRVEKLSKIILNPEVSTQKIHNVRTDKEIGKQAKEIAQVEDILSKVFGTPTDNANDTQKSANIDGKACTKMKNPLSDVMNREANDEGGDMSGINESEGGVINTTNANLNSKEDAEQSGTESLQTNTTELSAIETARSAHIRTINSDIVRISKALHSELACRVVDSSEFHDTTKKMDNFNAYCSTLVYDQMHTAQLDNVSAVLQCILASAKKKVKKAPTVTDPSNPYAHIAPPAAYKARPPDIIPVQATTISSEKAGPNTHVTRSVKKEMLRNLHENG